MKYEICYNQNRKNCSRCCSNSLNPRCASGQRSLMQGCQHVFTKNARSCRKKKPDSSFEAYTHKTCITKHKIDIKTRQKHRYNTIPLLGSIFFPRPRNYSVGHLFLINNIEHFYGNSKIFSIFCAPCVVIDSFQNKFVMDVQLIQCLFQSQAFPTERSQILSGFCISKKSQRC